MRLYTNADLRTCAKAIDNPARPGAIAESVLDAVAPAIAARALREAAGCLRSDLELLDHCDHAPGWLDLQADEIERGAL